MSQTVSAFDPGLEMTISSLSAREIKIISRVAELAVAIVEDRAGDVMQEVCTDDSLAAGFGPTMADCADVVIAAIEARLEPLMTASGFRHLLGSYGDPVVITAVYKAFANAQNRCVVAEPERMAA